MSANFILDHYCAAWHNEYIDTVNQRKGYKMNIDLNKIIQVYSGKHGCVCGCLGSYSESKIAIHSIYSAWLANGQEGEDHLYCEDNIQQIWFTDSLSGNQMMIEFKE